jgi:enoyl-[acyl-carrier protein] reductase I
MDLFKDRKGLVVGIANERSIAFGIARSLHKAGAELAITYQNERLGKRVLPIADKLEAALTSICDLGQEADLKKLKEDIEQLWGKLDFVVHAVAFADQSDLEGRFIDTKREGFQKAMDISVYSFINLARSLEPLLAKGHSPSLITLTYEGSRRVIPNYNVMGVAKAALEAAMRYLANDLGQHGIRVNALSPGPIKTLSAAGIKGLRDAIRAVESQAPLQRSVGIDDVGDTALWLLSDWARGVSGEIIHVDAGHHIVGMSQTSP